MWPIIASVGAFIPGLFGREISFKAAKVVGVIVSIVLAILFLYGAKSLYDYSVVRADRAERAAALAEAARKADHEADEKARKGAAREAETQKKLDDALREAADRDPVGAKSPVGPVSRSYYDTIPEK